MRLKWILGVAALLIVSVVVILLVILTRYDFNRLKPEIIACWEDIGFKTGMLISPDKFREFCAPLYREVAEVAESCGVAVCAVDSDGCAMELVPILAECGFNGLYPFEAKAGLAGLGLIPAGFIIWKKRKKVMTDPN